ncbi:MAG: hypothetical protein LBM41_02880 [Ruminococcus sp.]|jgi:hypothetical protein|nr:hypothetical protein [Ruminococcus sp.]
MNFKKIVAAVAASALALSLFAVSASAADPVTFTLDAQNAGYGEDYEWEVTSTPVTFEGNGEYTVDIDLSANPSDIWCKLNTPGNETAPAGWETATVEITSVKINDIDWPLVPNHAKNPGAFYAPVEGATEPFVNFNVWNVWYEPGNVIDMTNTKAVAGTGYSFLDDAGKRIVVEKMSVTFKVDGVDGVGLTAADVEAANATTAPATGNVPVIAIGAVMALAVVGAVVSRKRK